jgi:class 3 adenylate cyclase
MTLNSLLTPRQTSIALLQADIRGFSKLSKIYSDLEMVTYIQSYYENVVEKAQAHAQLHLIGDCIFLFIEQNYDNEKSASDLAFDIAKDLSKSTSELNIKNKDKEDVNFGIAIHFGAAVIGNLSSSSCIDYTVLGNEVNKVARIEELTKNEFIQNNVGHNGVLLSKEALNNLRFYNDIKFEKITLQDHGLAIRSFESTEEVYYLDQSKLVNSAS